MIHLCFASHKGSGIYLYCDVDWNELYDAGDQTRPARTVYHWDYRNDCPVWEVDLKDYCPDCIENLRDSFE